MSELQSVASLLSWLPLAALLLAGASITVGLRHAYCAIWLFRHRDIPVSDPVIAKALEGVDPPRYGVYAVLWLAAGIVLAGLGIQLLH
ncbi:hypothetical protein ACQHIH_21355 (plasmid) [Xanthomonas sontii]|uniref:hypothetical protein n=1 Tax=Xanthomonas sontii TaxID=2650745 RepID=UPI003F874C5C